ncbi:hypothetical protein BCR34DRAFT_177590 [Clohesyomyces aquaticus]|uniref:Uncharacterized protein n=1 Tax=Clohesyomyces aquaticus TaxID=1231657 RepID=A0A1Y1ZZC2_9PLEO|nr:hypothetical protein BCR34DRAFT_177590 [Clohesyomyces aquaticus]
MNAFYSLLATNLSRAARPSPQIPWVKWLWIIVTMQPSLCSSKSYSSASTSVSHLAGPGGLRSSPTESFRVVGMGWEGPSPLGMWYIRSASAGLAGWPRRMHIAHLNNTVLRNVPWQLRSLTLLERRPLGRPSRSLALLPEVLVYPFPTIKIDETQSLVQHRRRSTMRGDSDLPAGPLKPRFILADQVLHLVQ